MIPTSPTPPHARLARIDELATAIRNEADRIRQRAKHRLSDSQETTDLLRARVLDDTARAIASLAPNRAG